MVHMAQSRSDPEDIVAIKCIDKKALRGKEDSLENEIRVLRRLVEASRQDWRRCLRFTLAPVT